MASRLVHIAAWAAFILGIQCLDLDVADESSIKKVASQIASGLYTYHNPNSTAGQFDQPEPWFWWISGAGWTSLIDYTVYTGDDTYQEDILSALSQTSNIGANYDFVPEAQVGYEANDDQVYWVYAALTAAEYGFQPLPCKGADSGADGDCANAWHVMAANAFETFATRWNADADTCNGGLAWQYNPQATGQTSGSTYKNAVTNAGFFQTAARLARFTGNQTYADWATKVWDWSYGVGLVGSLFHVFDGTSDAEGANCSSINHDEWTYNIASYLHGAAHMYAYTEGGPTWEKRVQGLISAANSTFFGPADNATNVMYEQICEPSAACSTDQSSFKGSLANWMGKTAILVPSVRDGIMDLLKPTARGAASSCSGDGNSTCGVRWYVGEYDGQTGFGQELSALEAVLGLLVPNAPKLATLK